MHRQNYTATVEPYAGQVLPQQTGKTISLWIWILALGHCHEETGKAQTETVTTKLEAYYCLRHQCML